MHRADHIGSLLRPKKLREAFRAHSEKKLDDNAFRAVHVFINPSLDCRVARLLHLLPFIRPNRLVTFNDAHLPDLLDTHDIIVEVEAVENTRECHDIRP